MTYEGLVLLAWKRLNFTSIQVLNLNNVGFAAVNFLPSLCDLNIFFFCNRRKHNPRSRRQTTGNVSLRLQILSVDPAGRGKVGFRKRPRHKGQRYRFQISIISNDITIIGLGLFGVGKADN